MFKAISSTIGTTADSRKKQQRMLLADFDCNANIKNVSATIFRRRHYSLAFEC